MGLTSIRPVTLILTVCGATSCGAAALSDGSKGGGDFIDSAIEDRCHESVELSVFAAERHCECLVAAGEHPDQATCVAERAIAETDIECVCSTYARYPESNAFIDCFLPLQQAHADCLVDAKCEQAKLDACAEAYARPQCQPPADAADEVASTCISP
jgi:hypothetical protein